MKTVTEHIRSHLYTMAGLNRPVVTYTVAELEADIAEKFHELDRVVELAKNRLVIGSCRYGLASAGTHANYDYGNEAHRRIMQYRNTGNLEKLVDALNFCALEFNYPHVDGAHWSPEDDGEHSERIK